MGIRYKIDVLQALKDKGYTTYRLRKDRLLSEGAIQSLREGKYISFDNLDTLCKLLGCNVGDILDYVEEK